MLIELHYKIARIFNSVASKGDHIQELILGLQQPQEKPGKSKGAPENLTTIILLTLLRNWYGRKNMGSS